MAIRKQGRPQRMCIVTRTKLDSSKLWRFVYQPTPTGGQLIFDENHTAPGRGAWLLPELQVFHQAVEQQAFHRALRVHGQLDTDTATQAVSQWCRARNGKGGTTAALTPANDDESET